MCLMYTCGTSGCDRQCHEYVSMLRVDKLRFTKQHMTQILPKHAPTHSSLMWEFRILSQLSSVRSCLATCRKHGYSKYFQKCPEKLPNEDRLRRRMEWEMVMLRLTLAHPVMQCIPLVVHGRPNVEKVFMNKITMSSKLSLPMHLLAQILVPVPALFPFFPVAWMYPVSGMFSSSREAQQQSWEVTSFWVHVYSIPDKYTTSWTVWQLCQTHPHHLL